MKGMAGRTKFEESMSKNYVMSAVAIEKPKPVWYNYHITTMKNDQITAPGINRSVRMA